MRNRLAIIGILSTAAFGAANNVSAQQQWTRTFRAPASEFASSGTNPYFVLEPGFKTTLQDGKNRLEITVSNDTKMVDGVETRVVEEREWQNGELAEVSRNYYAISTRTNAVYYFGEDVDIYKGGKVTAREGAWQSGVNGAHFGMMMPGDPLAGARYYQEIAPGIAWTAPKLFPSTV